MRSIAPILSLVIAFAMATYVQAQMPNRRLFRIEYPAGRRADAKAWWQGACSLVLQDKDLAFNNYFRVMKDESKTYGVGQCVSGNEVDQIDPKNAGDIAAHVVTQTHVPEVIERLGKGWSIHHTN
ncbi:hypothetical protein CBOM_02510 [Ceraceosorus bombacis]|uniref:Uncharacterized protein n=1 Tax=Ceraceosorus bombacis TaxID=401625 RepID=A0A0P1BGR6_9BASI|nr:hypothetical protein CBOM_02510 [Ceraceosorus bombacis]